MITKRLLILQGIVLFGMGVIFLLPPSPKSQPLGTNSELPPLIGNWYGQDEKVTEKEHQVLGAETQFSRKRYRNDAGEEIYVSVVLGGQDMNTSIHRPERCLPAQGWTIMDSRIVSIPLKGSSDTKKSSPRLKVMRLHNMHPARTASGTPFSVYNVNYYWFVGYSDTTASHFRRSWFDIRDRLLKGYNQRWAYVTVMAMLNTDRRPDEQVDRVVQDFIRELVPTVHKDSVVHY